MAKLQTCLNRFRMYSLSLLPVHSRFPRYVPKVHPPNYGIDPCQRSCRGFMPLRNVSDCHGWVQQKHKTAKSNLSNQDSPSIPSHQMFPRGNKTHTGWNKGYKQEVFLHNLHIRGVSRAKYTAHVKNGIKKCI